MHGQANIKQTTSLVYPPTIHLITLRSLLLLENLLFHHYVNKLPAFCGILMFITPFTIARYLSFHPEKDKLNSSHLRPLFSKINSHIFFPSVLRSLEITALHTYLSESSTIFYSPHHVLHALPISSSLISSL